MIAVLFNKPGKSPGDKISKKSLLKKMRLLRREDVRLLASEALPKMPDCIMKKPKKLQVCTVSVAVDENSCRVFIDLCCW